MKLTGKQRSAARLTGLVLAAVLLLALLPAFALADTGFSDVADSDWFAADVQYAVDKGLMKGTGDAVFEPQTTVSRGMIVTVLYRLEGEPEVTDKNAFSDVADDAWYAKAVTWAAVKGIVKGYGEDQFGPADPLNREQFATLLYRYAGYKELDVTAAGDLDAFADKDEVSEYAKEALIWAVSKELLNGMDGKLVPAGSATRAQMAAILHRFCEKIIDAKPAEDFDPAKAYADLLDKYEAVVSGAEEWKDGDGLGSPEFFGQIPIYNAPQPGYAFIDINDDGVEELVIGPDGFGESEELFKGLIYTLYTCKDGKPVKVCESIVRGRYYLLEDGKRSHEWSSSATESGVDYYTLAKGGDKLEKTDASAAAHKAYTVKPFSFDPGKAYAALLEQYRTALTGEEEWQNEDGLGNKEFFDQAIKNAPKPGYAFLDINNDGKDELLIGPNGTGSDAEYYTGLIYVLYTYKDGKPVKVCESADRVRFYLLEDGVIKNVGSDRVDNLVDFYTLDPVTGQLSTAASSTAAARACSVVPFVFSAEDAYFELLRQYRFVASGDAPWSDELGSPEFFGQIPGYNAPKAGCALMDLNGDGMEELVIGPQDFGESEEWFKGLIYVLYTIKDGKPVKVCESIVRGRYYLLEDGKLSHEWSSSATESGVDTYVLEKGATTLTKTDPSEAAHKDYDVLSF